MHAAHIVHLAFLPQGHKHDGSFNSVRAFARPKASLDTSLHRATMREVGAHPVMVGGERGKRKGEEGGGEGSSTESSHMHEVEGEQFIDMVIDSQYVLIEASPSSREKVGGASAVYFCLV